MTPTRPTIPMIPILAIALGIALLVGAMLLPFLPGRYDPLAASLSLCATLLAFGALLLVPVGVVWLMTGRGVACARFGLVLAAVIAAAATLAAMAGGSASAGGVLLVSSMAGLVHLWKRVGAAHRRSAPLPRAVPIALMLVPLAAVVVRLAPAESLATWSRGRAIANAAAIIADIERFHTRTGTYPVALNSLWPDYPTGIIGVERYRYEPSGEAYNLYFEHPSTNPATQEIVMYNPRGEQDFSSHAADLLQLSPEDIRRQRGYFASQNLPQAHWKRFLYD